MRRVRAERLRLGWSQTTLAFYSGLATSDVSRVEAGRTSPQSTQLDRIAAVLGVDREALLEDVPEPDERGAHV